VGDVGDEVAAHALERLEARHVEEEDEGARRLVDRAARQRRDAQLERPSRPRHVKQRLADRSTRRERRFQLAEDRRVAHDLGEQAAHRVERRPEELAEGVVRHADLPVRAQHDHPFLHRAHDGLEEEALAPALVDLLRETAHETGQCGSQVPGRAGRGDHEGPRRPAARDRVDALGQGFHLLVERAERMPSHRRREHERGQPERERGQPGLHRGDAAPRRVFRDLEHAERGEGCGEQADRRERRRDGAPRGHDALRQR